MKLAKTTALQSLNRNRTNEVSSSQGKSLSSDNQIVEQFLSPVLRLLNPPIIEGAIPIGAFNNFEQHQRLEQLCTARNLVLHPCNLNLRGDYWGAIANNYEGFNGQMCCWDQVILDQNIEEIDE